MGRQPARCASLVEAHLITLPLRCGVARRDGGTPESRDCHDGFRVVRE